MADYTKSKGPLGAVGVENAVESAYGQLEPLVDYERIKDEFLFGIPLVSSVKDPFTNKPQVMTANVVKRIVERAVTKVEGLTGICIFPTQFDEKFPFDQGDYQALGYFQIPRRPVASIEQISVTPANNVDVYVLPKEWIETAYLVRGQLHVMPQTIAINGGGYMPVMHNAGGLFFLAFMGQRSWVPAFWKIKYTAGFPDGNLPRLVNELIGVTASIDILSQLAATNAKSTSHSLGIDGLSQSVGGPGPEVYTTRINQLKEEQEKLVGRVKAIFGLKITFSNV